MNNFSILFAEDDVHKSKYVRELCLANYPGVDLIEVASVKSAITKINERAFDLLLLDMSLPTFDVSAGEGGGRPQGSGGMEILRELERVNYSPMVIVVTQYADFSIDGKWYLLSELQDELASEHGDAFLGLVEFDTTKVLWQDSLMSLMEKFKDRGGF